MQDENISLYFNEGGSDKEYHAELLEVEDAGFLVNFRYGRRGSALTGGSKTKDPLPYDKAKKVYDKLVAEKAGKGYTTGESGTAYQDTPKESLFTGILPQLLNAVDESELERLFEDSAWVMQEKKDGERRLVCHDGDGLYGVNRKGLRVSLPMPVAEALADLPGVIVMDGEIIGDVYYPFDLLQYDGQDLREDGFYKRYDILRSALEGIQDPSVKLVPVHVFVDQKRQLFDRVKQENGEGVTFKKTLSSYEPGRPNSGGPHLKFKFVESATLVVDGQSESKRSVKVAAFDENGNKAQLGNVTIPPNYDVPEIGAIVEIEYLYAYQGGCIYQPVYRGKRADQELSDCKLSQLKYKPMEKAA
jgi:bifunctional non-homologous end joining protein LigD